MFKRRELTEEEREQQRQRARDLRAQLRGNSDAARMLMEIGEADSVNGGLIEIYTDADNYEFNTFGQWLKLGKAVRKGEHCRYPVWGEPVKRATPGAEATATPAPAVQEGAEGEDDATKFWPICKLFSNAQVEAKTPRK